jgi:hypothetical protein
VIEEALLVGLESRVGGGLGLAVKRAVLGGDVGRLQCLAEIAVNDLEGARIGEDSRRTSPGVW